MSGSFATQDRSDGDDVKAVFLPDPGAVNAGAIGRASLAFALPRHRAHGIRSPVLLALLRGATAVVTVDEQGDAVL